MTDLTQIKTPQDLPTTWRDLHDSLTPLCDRKQIASKSQLVAAGTISNRDSQGRGIAGKMQAGNRVVYPRFSAVLWLMAFVDEAMTEGASHA